MSPHLPVSLSANVLIALVIALASFLLYLRTLAPDVVDADGGEFQFAAWNFGFVHPTGYPLYLILGGVFQHLVPIGNPAFRLNLFTAITGALAVATIYLAAHELTRHRSAALIASSSFALTRMFWYDASAAETYALNAFFVALLIYLALRWQSEPTGGNFAALCFAFGLALTHHRSVLLWLPALALFFWVSGFRFRVPRSKVASLVPIAACLLPLLLYLYIPLRASASPYFALPLSPNRSLILYDNSFPGFMNYVLGRTFQSEISWDAVSVARLTALPQLLFDQFGVFGVALGIFGSVMMSWRREWAKFILLFAGFAATILFASIYHIGDIGHYYIPAYLVWAVWIGYGILVSSQMGMRPASPSESRLALAFRLMLAAFVLVPQFIFNLPFADRSHETMAREEWTRLLASAPQNAILISNDRDEMMPLWYLQFVENTRRDVVGLFPLITPAPEYSNVSRLTESVIDTDRPVFFIKNMPGLEIKFRAQASGALWQVVETNRLPERFIDAVLGKRVRLLGFDAMRDADALRVAICWIPLVKLDANYTTFVHLLDSNGKKIAQGTDHQVGGEFYPTTLWDAGETLRDEFVIALPPNIGPGEYRLLVGMYRSSDGEMLGEPVVVGGVEMK